ncbi:MAG TPA: J domain-containing protein [bacterium]|nr:J domain-containing protein [bacterium]
MEFKDYYKILGVPRNADEKAIRQAFRKLARQHHPDVNPNDKKAEQRFKEINEAYQVLNDAERRAKYDQVLELRERGGGWEEILGGTGARGGPGMADGGTFRVYTSGDPGQFSEFFEQLFGGLGGGAFGEGVFGGGARRGRGRAGGRTAGGGGAGRGGINLEDVMRAQQAAPPAADVEGTVAITLEEAFRGTHRTVVVPAEGGRAERSLDITIPPGVRSGQRIRAAGGGHDGDLYLRVDVLPHPVFTRDGDDVTAAVDVPVWTAALGGTIEAPTLGGPVTLTVPSGTRDGQVFRLRGRGMPHVRGGGAGDELARVRLTLPQPLTDADRRLFEEMRRLHEAAAPKA